MSLLSWLWGRNKSSAQLAKQRLLAVVDQERAARGQRRPDYLLKVKGESMRDDGIFDGDLVAVKRASDARNGQVVVARIDGEITIKRLERGRARIRLLPRNPEHQPIEVGPGQDFAIEGVYCGLVRRS